MLMYPISHLETRAKQLRSRAADEKPLLYAACLQPDGKYQEFPTPKSVDEQYRKACTFMAEQCEAAVKALKAIDV